MIPVVDDAGRLLGVVSEAAVRRALGSANRAEVIQRDVMALLETSPSVLPETARIADAVQMLTQGPSGMILVVDERSHLLGGVFWHDVFDTARRPVTFQSIGGMATPFGIHLAAGNVQAGVRSWGLVGSGVCLGLMLAAAYLLVGAVCWMVDYHLGTDYLHLWSRLDPPSQTVGALVWLGVQGLAAVVFLAVLWMSPLTRYHGAEHQVVHALERGEPLTPAVVARMPRVHPRCGTNVLAAVALFGAVVGLVTALSPWSSGTILGSVLGAVITLRVWRRLGDWLQAHVTTREPNDHQRVHAIEVAQELQEQYSVAANCAPSKLARVWASGVPQVGVGVFIGVAVPVLILSAFMSLLLPDLGGLRLW